MKKAIAAVVITALLIAGAGVSCTVAVMSATVGTMMTTCLASHETSGAGAGTLEVVGDLPAIDGFTEVQVANAAIVVATANERELGVQGARIGLITALQESGLRNLANAGRFVYPAGTRVMPYSQWAALRPIVATSVDYPHDGVAAGDWDSIGLFQGRYSISTWSGEGPPEQKIRNLLDPAFTSGRFFDALVRVDGWAEMRPAAAAQAVQRSAFPDAYAKHWEASGRLVEALASVDVSASSAGPCGAQQSPDVVTAEGWTRPITGHRALTSPFGMRLHPVLGVWRMHDGQDFSAAWGTPIFAAADGIVVRAGHAGPNTNNLYWVVIDHGGGVLTRYLHPEANGIFVKPGQQVTGGQQIAAVGSSGFSTGPHLHFEVSVGGSTVDPMAFLAARGVVY